MKSLVAILHYNTISYTNNLYEMLKPFENDGQYDLIVIDNGSDVGKQSKYTNFTTGENLGYGGALDVAMNYFIENTEYDSFVLLNSDLIIHGYNFIKELKKQLFSDDKLMIISPCVIQPEKNQCHWKQMHSWGFTTLRYVPFVDFQCALMKREFAEKIQSFGSKYGWVQDLMTGIVCEDNDWKIGVCDWLPIVHIGNGTVKDNPHLSNYNLLAQEEMNAYFQSKNLVNRAESLKSKSINYIYE